jgi:CBS domain-containing protein
MQVREIMTRDVVTVRPETPVNEIARAMVGRDLSGLPVVGASGEVLGMVSELDLIARNARLEPPAFFKILDGWIPLESPAHYLERLRHMLGTRARDVMTAPAVSIAPDEPMEALADLLLKRRVNPVPVVESGRLVGIVSRTDVVRMMARALDVQGG